MWSVFSSLFAFKVFSLRWECYTLIMICLIMHLFLVFLMWWFSTGRQISLFQFLKILIHHSFEYWHETFCFFVLFCISNYTYSGPFILLLITYSYHFIFFYSFISPFCILGKFFQFLRQPGLCFTVVRASACGPKGNGFDYQSKGM